MADQNQEYEMNNGEDFSQDVSTQGEQLNGTNGENGSGDAPADSGSAEAPGRDDDRYVNFILILNKVQSIF